MPATDLKSCQKESVHHCYKTLEHRYKIRSAQTSKNEVSLVCRKDKKRKESTSDKKSKKQKFQEKQNRLMETEVVKFFFERSESRIREKNSGDVIQCIRKKRRQCLNAFNANSFPIDCNDRLLISKRFKFFAHIKDLIRKLPQRICQ